jgi:hypothetical protein
MKKLCAICGVNPAVTSDHIPPQSLYPKPRDNDINLNTVPACKECNNGASTDDEEFKVFIGITTGEHQIAQDKVIDSIARTIGGNQKIANNIFKNQRNVYAKLNSEILESAVAITLDRTRYERVITRIVKALHWMETGKAQNADLKTTVLPGDNLDAALAQSIMEVMHSLPLRPLNKGTFLYRGHVSEDGSGIWGMQFFEHHTVFAITYTEKPHN